MESSEPCQVPKHVTAATKPQLRSRDFLAMSRGQTSRFPISIAIEKITCYAHRSQEEWGSLSQAGPHGEALGSVMRQKEWRKNVVKNVIVASMGRNK